MVGVEKAHLEKTKRNNTTDTATVASEIITETDAATETTSSAITTTNAPA